MDRVLKIFETSKCQHRIFAIGTNLLSLLLSISILLSFFYLGISFFISVLFISIIFITSLKPFYIFILLFAAYDYLQEIMSCITSQNRD